MPKTMKAAYDRNQLRFCRLSKTCECEIKLHTVEIFCLTRQLKISRMQVYYWNCLKMQCIANMKDRSKKVCNNIKHPFPVAQTVNNRNEIMFHQSQ